MPRDAHKREGLPQFSRAISPWNPDRLGADYRKAGWKKFDPSAAPYDVSKVERERMRR